MEKKIGCCDCCGYEGIPLKEYTHGHSVPQAGKPYWLCEVCATSLAGHWKDYSINDLARAEMSQLTAWMTNRIIAEVRRNNSHAYKKGIDWCINRMGEQLEGLDDSYFVQSKLEELSEIFLKEARRIESLDN